MTITIQVPNPKHIALRTQMRGQIALANARYNATSMIEDKKAAHKERKYERMIRKSQKKIGPYQP